MGVIFDNFYLKKFPPKPSKRGGEDQKMLILALGANSTKFCIHNLWASRELEMQKLGAGVLCGVGCRAGLQGARGGMEGMDYN